MCGIAGVMTSPDGAPVEFEDLRAMIAMLGHRGPDGYGLYRDDRVGLANARLSIVGLSDGFQPISNEDGSIWIVCNGEIFNAPELRRDLERRGHRFATTTDIEVIVHAFEEHGADAWRKLNGQFAFALWDHRVRELWLVRDPLGILPLHYARSGPRLLFGSEAKALFADGRMPIRLDPAGLAQVFTRWSASAPDNVFVGVRSVRPGTALRIGADLAMEERRYWRLDLETDEALRGIDLDEAAEALGERLSRAVERRLWADVPVGAYISGGLDSSVVGVLARRHKHDSLRTFSVQFEDPRYDESAEQRRMAELLRSRHHAVVCLSDDIPRLLPEVVWHCETPLLRTAPVPMFALSRLVRETGIKTVLTGEGADELLAGYSIFKEDKIRRFWARRPDSRLRPLLLRRVHPEVGAAAARDAGLWQAFFRQGLTEVDHPFYSHLIRWSNTRWTLRFLAPDVRDRLDPGDLAGRLEREAPEGWCGWDPLARAQWTEIHSFMSSYLLSSQGDRVAMGNGVEVRYPFLDPEVVAFCSALPARVKMPALHDKAPLRAFARRLLPEDIWRRPKQPYRAPVGPALFGAAGLSLVDEFLSDAALARFGLVDRDAAGRLVEKARRQGGRMTGEREEMALVGILTLQLLAHAFLETFGVRARERRRELDRQAPRRLVDRSRGTDGAAARRVAGSGAGRG